MNLPRSVARTAVTTALLLVAVLAGLLLAGGPSPAAEETAWTPPAETIVKITGTAEDGFAITHYDGTELFPPTTSEAIAECGEYDRAVDRVRCRAEVRTWYRDLADTRRAMRYARVQARRAARNR